MAEEKRNEGELSPEQPQALRFEDVFMQYDESMAAIRDFSSTLTPFVSEMEKDYKDRRDKIVTEVMQRLPKEDRKELKKLLSASGPEIEVKPRVEWVFGKIIGILIHSYPPGIHRELLNKSILMCLVSHFEVLVSDLAHLYYRLVPDATAGEDPVLSVNELRSFKSIDDALEFVISHRVDNLLREGLDEWHKFFKTRMKIDLDQLAPDSAQWKEFFQRRHIIVHAGGRVTERYLANVEWDKIGDAPPPVGKQLELDDSYIARAINAFEVAGLLLCQEAWKKLAPKETNLRLGSLTGLGGAVYRRLLSQNWCVAEHLANWGAQDSNAPEDVMLICKLNKWLCIKRQGRWEEVAKEVEAFDTAAKHPRYSIVQASLLERADKFFKLLPAAIGAGVTADELNEWPILEEMRADPRFAEAIAKLQDRETE